MIVVPLSRKISNYGFVNFQEILELVNEKRQRMIKRPVQDKLQDIGEPLDATWKRYAENSFDYLPELLA